MKQKPYIAINSVINISRELKDFIQDEKKRLGFKNPDEYLKYALNFKEKKLYEKNIVL